MQQIGNVNYAIVSDKLWALIGNGARSKLWSGFLRQWDLEGRYKAQLRDELEELR